ncbi:MAG: SUMF1/EgtB/PvdO family nonheme iron enzyme [Sandaracinaceae bacterium]
MTARPPPGRAVAPDRGGPAGRCPTSLLATYPELAAALRRGRAATLALVDDLDDGLLCAQPHPGFSPIGWHLGHVAFTEAQWVLGRLGGDDRLWKANYRRWAQDGCAKAERRAQPPRRRLLAYLAEVRDAVEGALAGLAPGGDEALLRDGFVLWFLAAHEHQHRETIAIVRQLIAEDALDPTPPVPAPGPVEERWTTFDRATTAMGTDDRLAYDNERSCHDAATGPFLLGRAPVTAGAWDAFRADGGYARPELWTDAGWAWRERCGVEAPRGWVGDADGRRARVGLRGERYPVANDEPVMGVSAHEADAYARWRGARLPTEAEWERAARSHVAAAQPVVAAPAASAGPAGLVPRVRAQPPAVRARPPSHVPPPALDLATDRPRPSPAGDLVDLLGIVWEWTATPFHPYPGFSPFPYRGYSAPYFDGAHRVLRGGCFATSATIARATFRNWYAPGVREVFAGVRLARDAR